MGHLLDCEVYLVGSKLKMGKIREAGSQRPSRDHLRPIAAKVVVCLPCATEVVGQSYIVMCSVGHCSFVYSASQNK